MLEKRNDEWVPMKMCCPTCGTVNIGYGHFNSPDFPWEKTDAVPELMKVAI